MASLKNVFIDTSVLMDVLIQREPFYMASAQVWSLAEKGIVCGLISVISFNNIYYVVRKQKNRRIAERTLVNLRDTFVPISLNKQILNQAIDAGFADFEDAIQYFSAVQGDADYLVSRNPKHFKNVDLPILSPDEFIVALGAQEK
jgi:predicted nucleic acid-binding protein